MSHTSLLNIELYLTPVELYVRKKINNFIFKKLYYFSFFGNYYSILSGFGKTIMIRKRKKFRYKKLTSITFKSILVILFVCIRAMNSNMIPFLQWWCMMIHMILYSSYVSDTFDKKEKSSDTKSFRWLHSRAFWLSFFRVF